MYLFVHIHIRNIPKVKQSAHDQAATTTFTCIQLYIELHISRIIPQG